MKAKCFCVIFHSMALEFELSVIPKGSKEKDSETSPGP